MSKRKPLGFNEMKMLVLQYLKDNRSATSKELCQELDLELSSCKSLMTRLRTRQKLVRIEGTLPQVFSGRKELVFVLTKRGEGRLEYLLEKQKKEKS